MTPAYFDSNATTRLAPEAASRLCELATAFVANPSSPHVLGRQAAKLLEESRDRIVALLGIPGRLLFTSGGSESNALALLGALRPDGIEVDHLIVSKAEHESVHGLLEMPHSVPATACDLDPSGRPDLDHLERLLRRGRALVSMMHANNETGVVFPIREIAARVHDNGGFLHVDAAQSVGKADLSELRHADAVTWAAHKAHGPIGVGGIIVANERYRIRPLSAGGGQEGGVRSGTVNVPAIAATAEAIAGCLADTRTQEELAAPRDAIERFVTERLPSAVIVARDAMRLWSTSLICFPGLLQDDLIDELSQVGICVGRGAACSSGLGGLRVLRAMGVDDLSNQSAIRFSSSRLTTAGDLARLLDELPGAYERAMRRSPYA